MKVRLLNQFLHENSNIFCLGYEDSKVDPEHEWSDLADIMLKVDMAIQILLFFVDIGLLIGCVKEKLTFLYIWIASSVIFIVLTITETIVAGMAFDPSPTLTIAIIIALVDIFVSFWTILVVFGATKEIKIIRKIPYY